MIIENSIGIKSSVEGDKRFLLIDHFQSYGGCDCGQCPNNVNSYKRRWDKFIAEVIGPCNNHFKLKIIAEFSLHNLSLDRLIRTKRYVSVTDRFGELEVRISDMLIIPE